MTDFNKDSLSADLRLEYFMERVFNERTFWLLQAQDGMFAMFEDDNEQAYIPFWPDKEYAEKHIADDWGEYNAESMGLFEFFNWIEELEGDEIKIAVFPDADLQVIPLSPGELRKYFEITADKQ